MDLVFVKKTLKLKNEINSPRNTFVFTTYLPSGVHEPNENYLKGAWQRKG